MNLKLENSYANGPKNKIEMYTSTKLKMSSDITYL